MSLRVAPPPRAGAHAATRMAHSRDQSKDETSIYNRPYCEALVARFESATARGVATIVPPECKVDKYYLDQTGFQRPLVVKTPAQLDLLVPTPESLSLDDLTAAVGGERRVRAIDVAAQRELCDEWTLTQWMAYFATPLAQRERVLNLISLECSGTKLEKLVRPPKIVQEISWVDKHWATSGPKKEKPLVPKVQLYCLMSAASSYTEFHIDFGGSSVWYHLYQGRKLFFIAPPTDANLARFAQWEDHYCLGQTPFFGDVVGRRECSVVELCAGDTLLLPSGWIHAVYSSDDSIAFGGNFLSSYHMASHLRSHRLEKKQLVEGRFHFPEFECVVWYAAVYYGRMLSTCPSLLTKWEWQGLRELVAGLSKWLTSRDPHDEPMERVVAICKAAVHVAPAVMLEKMRGIVHEKAKQLEEGGDLTTHSQHTSNVPRAATDNSSDSSSSGSASSDSSDSSTDDSSDGGDDTGNESDHGRQAPSNEGNADPNNSNSSDSSSDDDDSSSSSSSSDNEDNDDHQEPEENKEPEKEKEEQEEEQGELDEPDESSSSESDNDDNPDPESSYPDMPPIPVDSLIAIRKRAKLKDLQITKDGKDQVVALARQRLLDSQHPPKKTKKKSKVAVAVGAPVITTWAEEDRWTVACSCGLGGENYDDGRMMVECNNCNNWVHGECVDIPIHEIFWCFKCRASDDWLFVCPCGVKQKNFDDGNRMVQCDKCENWQHTYCAGIPATEEPPENFSCKICSKPPKKQKATTKPPRKKVQKKQRVQAAAASSDTGRSTIAPAPIPASPTPPEMTPPPPPPPPSAPPSPARVEEEEAYSPPKQRKRGRPSLKSKDQTSKRREHKNLSSVHLETPASPAGVHRVVAAIARPPLPHAPKSPGKSGKRKSSGGSARDRLEKKLKIRKSRA